MNQKKTLALIAAAALIVVAGNIFASTKETRNKMEEIHVQKDKDIEAIRYAQETIVEMLHEGLYDGRSMADMMRDFQGLTVLYRSK